MGIKDLNPFIKAHVPEAIETIHLKELSGKKVAIDTSIYFYKFLYRNDRYIESFFLQISKLVRWGIIPIYVFDGSPPKEKSEEIQHRITKKNLIKDKIEALNHKLNNENVDNPQTIYMEIAKLKKKLSTICFFFKALLPRGPKRAQEVAKRSLGLDLGGFRA